MAWFTAKEWKNRLVEFAGRRSLKNVSTNETTVYDVTRNEGQVSQEGDSFSATTMNDLEQRISDAFAEAEEANTQLINDIKFPDGAGFYPDIKDGQRGYNTDPARGADTFSPFSSIPELISSSVASNIARTFDVSSRLLHSKYTVDNFYLVAKGVSFGTSSAIHNNLEKSYDPDTGILSVSAAVNYHNSNNGFWLIYDVYLIDSVL